MKKFIVNQAVSTPKGNGVITEIKSDGFVTVLLDENLTKEDFKVEEVEDDEVPVNNERISAVDEHNLALSLEEENRNKMKVEE